MDIAKRNAVIRRKIAAGKSLDEIGREFGLSGTRIGQIRDGKRGGRVVRASHNKQEDHEQEAQTSTSSQEPQIAYVYGRIESQLEVYAAQLEIPFPQLAKRISELLSGKALGKVVRSVHNLPSMR